MSRHASSGHGRISRDRWLVSYADFITLLFAFFVVMFLEGIRSSFFKRRKYD
jgi:flagellar motor protein MotB